VRLSKVKTTSVACQTDEVNIAAEAKETTRQQQIPVTQNQTNDKNDGYHHTKNDRRKITRGQFGIQAVAETTPNPIVGRSVKTAKVQSATPQSRSTPNEDSGLSLIYVGHLAAETTEQAVRLHLLEIGVTDNQLADVIKLPCRIENETSFCISLNDKLAQNVLFDSNSWPTGVRVRHYTQKRNSSKPGDKNKPTRRTNNNSAPPRFRKQVKSMERETHCKCADSTYRFPERRYNRWQTSEADHFDHYEYDQHRDRKSSYIRNKTEQPHYDSQRNYYYSHGADYYDY
jgi:hypothetical protein